jgi:type IV secretory pathway TrbF-like protein
MQAEREIVVGRADATGPTARHKFLEIYAGPAVLNAYLRTTVVALSLAILALTYLLLRSNAALRNVKPLVIRIDQLGHAEAVSLPNFAYQPQEADNRYFLSQWTQLFYGRNRYTIQKDATQALLFLNGDLQSAIIDQNKKSKAIEGFLSDPVAPNIDIQIKNVSIEDLRTPPYRARIEFYKLFQSPIDHTEIKRELWTANVVYVFRDRVPNDMLLVNPLGLTITYFRQDQAFE